jgi:hypothetical protein
MNLFVEDQVPFGVSSPLSCPKDSELSEQAFDFLRFQHLYKQLDLPSIVNQHTLVVSLLNSRRVSETSSGSFDFWSAANLLSGFDASSPVAVAMANPSRLPPVSGDEESKEEPVSDWTGIGMASAIIIIIVGLLAKLLQSHQFPSEPSTAPEHPLVQDTHSDDDNVCRSECSLSFEEASPRLVLGILLDPDQAERAFDEDPLADSYTPYVVLNLDIRSDVGPLEHASPDVAALIDALQGALFSFQELQDMSKKFLLDLPRFVAYGIAILCCFALRFMVFCVTGRIGRRGLRELMKEFKNVKRAVCSFLVVLYADSHLSCDQDVMVAVDTVDDETLYELVETPEKQEGSEIDDDTGSVQIIDARIQEADDEIVTITPVGVHVPFVILYSNFL